jgi:hypothetical protein
LRSREEDNYEKGYNEEAYHGAHNYEKGYNEEAYHGAHNYEKGYNEEDNHGAHDCEKGYNDWAEGPKANGRPQRLLPPKSCSVLG